MTDTRTRDALRDVERGVDRLAAAHARAAGMLARPEPELRARASEVSGWSVGEHVFHLTLANELSLGHVLSLARGEGLLVRLDAEPDARSAAMLARGRIPRGVAQAPRFVRPPELAALDLAVLATVLGQVELQIARMRALAPALLAARGCVRHQLLGDLDARGWLRFARVHSAHHLAIAREVARAIAERPS